MDRCDSVREINASCEGQYRPLTERPRSTLEEEKNTTGSLDGSLREHIRSFGAPGALALLAFGYRAVEIWREEFPRDWEAVKEKAQARKKEKEAEEKSAKNRKA